MVTFPSQDRALLYVLRGVAAGEISPEQAVGMVRTAAVGVMQFNQPGRETVTISAGTTKPIFPGNTCQQEQSQ